ncbi:hypothetical protein LTR85_007532 [Meristemomyces frigidus]|nr:hypothetical protein LTR85_007532 [Meristemomyces frigidus]
MLRKHHFSELLAGSYEDLSIRMGFDLNSHICSKCHGLGMDTSGEMASICIQCDNPGGPFGRLFVSCIYRDDGVKVHPQQFISSKEAHGGLAVIFKAADSPGLTHYALREEIVRGLRLMVCTDHSSAQADLWERAPVLEQVIMKWRKDMRTSISGAEHKRDKEGIFAVQPELTEKDERIRALESQLAAAQIGSSSRKPAKARRVRSNHGSRDSDLSTSTEPMAGSYPRS